MAKGFAFASKTCRLEAALFMGRSHVHFFSKAVRSQSTNSKNYANLIEGLRNVGWRGRFLVSTLHEVESLVIWSRHQDQVADAVIEAKMEA
jgi:hypothetical protein